MEVKHPHAHSRGIVLPDQIKIMTASVHSLCSSHLDSETGKNYKPLNFNGPELCFTWVNKGTSLLDKK